jgi:uncharacterized protein (DUF2461 family)
VASVQRFIGFSDPQRHFFTQLAQRQDRAWFAGQRAAFERQWRQPMLALLDEVAERLAPLLEDGIVLGAMQQLQRAPHGVDPQHPQADLLRLKGLILRFPPTPSSHLAKRTLVTHLFHHARRVVEPVQWLAELA